MARLYIRAEPDTGAVLRTDALAAVAGEVAPAVEAAGGILAEPGVVDAPDDRLASLRRALQAIRQDGGIRVEATIDSPGGDVLFWPLVVTALGGLAFTLEEAVAPAEPDADSGPSDFPTPLDDDRPPAAPFALGPPMLQVSLFDGLEVVGTSYDHIETVTTAVTRMRAYGFDLPTDRLSIRFDPSRASCDRNTAYTAHGGADTLVVICNDHLPTLIHELAHVWAVDSLSDADRQTWLEHRELVSWSDGDWDDRGSEHLAEIVASGLADEFRPIMTTGRTDVQGTRDSFEFLAQTWLPTETPMWSVLSMTDQDLLMSELDSTGATLDRENVYVDLMTASAVFDDDDAWAEAGESYLEIEVDLRDDDDAEQEEDGPPVDDDPLLLQDLD